MVTNIEDRIRNTNQVEEPGAETLGAVIQAGDAVTPAIGGIQIITSAGYRTVYDTLTGIPSKINNNNLPSILKKKRADGSYVFGLQQTAKPKKYTFKCLLHKDDPNRAHYDDIGLAVCPKDNLASPHEVKRHMQKRHRVEWDAIEDERKVAEKQEDREFQRQLMGKAMGDTTPPLYVSDKDKKT